MHQTFTRNPFPTLKPIIQRLRKPMKTQPSPSSLSPIRELHVIRGSNQRGPNPSEPNRTQENCFSAQKLGQLGKETVNKTRLKRSHRKHPATSVLHGGSFAFHCVVPLLRSNFPRIPRFSPSGLLRFSLNVRSPKTTCPHPPPAPPLHMGNHAVKSGYPMGNQWVTLSNPW